MSDGRFEFPAPRPWRLEGEAIRDADGGVVVSALNPANMETRALIVRAVNGRDDLLKAREMLQAECRGLAAEADRMADLVRRLADNLERFHIHGDRDNALLREARKALGEAE